MLLNVKIIRFIAKIQRFIDFQAIHRKNTIKIVVRR